MIRTAIKTYDELRFPTTPILRRSSRDPKIENKYKEIENVKIFYSTRTLHIQNAKEFIEMYKKIKVTSIIIQKFLIKKYGTNFGVIFSKKIMKDYLSVNDNTDNWYYVWYDIINNKSKNDCLYLDQYHDNDSKNIKLYHDKIDWAIRYNIGIYIDPRTFTYKSIQLTPYIKKGYGIVSGFESSLDNWGLVCCQNNSKHLLENFDESDDEL